MTQVIEFKLPELGENIEQGDLVRLMVEPGATVSAGQSVMELETDKAVVEVPSSVSGTVQEIRVKEGEKIKVGQVIFTVDGADGKSADTAAPTKAPAPAPLTAKQAPSRSRSWTSESRSRLLPRLPRQSPARSNSPRLHRQQANSSSPNSAKTFLRAILVRLMVAPGGKGLRRPAGNGVGDRQSGSRSSVFGQRRGERGESQRRREGQSWSGDLHA